MFLFPFLLGRGNKGKLNCSQKLHISYLAFLLFFNCCTKIFDSAISWGGGEPKPKSQFKTYKLNNEESYEI